MLKSARPKSCEQISKTSNGEAYSYKATDHGFMVTYGDRQYDIKGIQRSDTQLKVTIKAAKNG